MTKMTPVDTPTDTAPTATPGQCFPWALAVAGGLLLALAFPHEVIPGALGDHPPFFVAWLALLPLMWLLFALPARQARWAGWWFGMTFFTVHLSWMRLFDLLPWLALALLLSLTFPLIIWLMQRMALPPWAAPLGLALVWSGVEWLRGQSAFGFSWAEIGASQVDGFPGRMAALGSVYLISFLMVWTTGTLVQCLRRQPLPRLLLPTLAGVLLLCLLGGWWQTRAARARWQAQTRAQVFTLVQPSPSTQRGLTPRALVTPSSYEEQQRRLESLLALTREGIAQRAATDPGDGPPLAVWAESAIGYAPQQAPALLAFLREGQCALLLGAPTHLPPSFHPRNSAYVFDAAGQGVGRYDKIHLVPFGEYVPLRPLVAWLRRRHIVPDVRANDIIPGDAWRPLPVAGHRLGIGICFESTFPGIARRYAQQQTDYLVYITNDAWFHRTSAVRQHFNHARFRALESGLPVIRAAGTGISGFIAPDGAILAEIPTYAVAARTQRIPAGVPGTVYSRLGWLFAPLCLLLGLLFSVRGVIITRRDSSRKRTSSAR